MLKNFWYAVENSSVVKDKPVKIRIFGQDIALFRDEEGKLSALSDLCVHRGAALSKGWVKKNCLVCPYHGWKFNGDGHCVEIPANKTKAIPKRARVDAYPAIEKYGWCWIFLGDLPEEQRPPIPNIEIATQKGWTSVRGEFEWNAHYSRVVENGVDIAHAPFVHRNSFGNIDEPEVEDYKVTGDDFQFSAEVSLIPPPPKGMWKWLRKKRQPVIATLTVYMPNITRLDLNFGKWKTTLIDSNIPIDENTTLTKYISYRNFFLGKWADKDAKRRVNKIFLEDQGTVESVRPELLPYQIADELHLNSDAMGIEYRKRRRKFLDQGWGIDMEKVRDLRGRKAVVIPSPNRRTEKENVWVIPEVPVENNNGTRKQTQPQ